MPPVQDDGCRASTPAVIGRGSAEAMALDATATGIASPGNRSSEPLLWSGDVARDASRVLRQPVSTICVCNTRATSRSLSSRTSVSITMTVRPTCSGREVAST